jgi:uncharacterized membrane protein YdbT with pleckstrin-like domain
MSKRDRSEITPEPGDDGEEELIFVERHFPIVLRWPLIWGLVIVLIAMIPWSISTANAYSWQPLGVKWMIFGFLFLLVFWGYNFIGWFFTVLILTDEKITYIQQKGLFNRSVKSLTLNNIQSVNYDVPGMQAAIFRFGNLKIETLSGSGHLRVKTFSHPARLQEEILAAVSAYGSTAEEGIVYDSKDKSDQN